MASMTWYGHQVRGSGDPHCNAPCQQALREAIVHSLSGSSAGGGGGRVGATPSKKAFRGA